MLRSAPGQAVFTGQQLRQTLEKPDVFLNEVAFKTLGLFPGTALQEGRWRALDGNRYVVSEQTVLAIGGSADTMHPTSMVDECQLPFLQSFCASIGAAIAEFWMLRTTEQVTSFLGQRFSGGTATAS